MVIRGQRYVVFISAFGFFNQSYLVFRVLYHAFFRNLLRYFSFYPPFVPVACIGAIHEPENIFS